MTFGIVGLGRMGNAIAERVLNAGYPVMGFDVHQETQEHARKMGVQLADLATIAQEASVIWLMVPAGDIVDQTLQQLVPHMPKNGICIDGGNSFFKDSIRRAEELQQKGLFYLDCGTSGGLHGRETGFSLMVGGKQEAYDRALPFFKAIAAKDGVGLFGPSGAGHYVKMVHNGIEYGLLQAYAEGFHIIKDGYFKKEQLDLAQITAVWQHGSIIRSHLLDLAHDIFKKDQTLTTISGEIAESGTGLWTVQEAREEHIPARIIEDALEVRKESRQTGGNFATKVVAMLRHAFGGHAVKKI